MGPIDAAKINPIQKALRAKINMHLVCGECYVLRSLKIVREKSA
jgi:hypothetical protein